MNSAYLIDLGTREFREVWQLQRELVAQRARGEIPDILLLVEHPHVFTTGRGSRDPRTHIRVGRLCIECHTIERGGGMTYHGPGQLVGYPIVNLAERGRDLHGYLRQLEEVIIGTLGDFQIRAQRRPGLTGVWTMEICSKKIASIGVAVRRWVSYHGFALNVNTDLRFFEAISPCGLDASVMTSLAQIQQTAIALELVKARLARRFSEVFDLALATSEFSSVASITEPA